MKIRSQIDRSICSHVLAVPLVICLCLSAVAKTPHAFSSGAADPKSVSALIPAFLDKSLDSKKSKSGDQIEAQVAAPIQLTDGTVIPRGAKMIGHITESTAKSKGDPGSSLNMVFEKIMMPEGKVLEIKGHVQAVGPNPNVEENGGGVDYGSSMNRTMEHAGPGQTSHTVVPILNDQSVGVSGLKNLELGEDGTLKSEGKTVRLDHGSQLLLKAEVLGLQ